MRRLPLNRVNYLGDLEQRILWTVLRLGESAYGLAIRDELEARTGRAVARGAVYITLDRLVEMGYLKSRLGERSAQRAGRARRDFRITAAGKTALRESKDALTSL